MKQDRLSSWLQQVRQPSLVGRSIGAVLLAFMLVWVALLGYLYLDRKRIQSNDHSLLRFAIAQQAALAHIHNEEQGRAFTAATATWMNQQRARSDRVSGTWELEFFDASGRSIYASPGLVGQSLAHPDTPIKNISIQGSPYLLVEARSPRWVLRIAEPSRSDWSFLQYNARSLIPYLLIALPIVLLLSWLPIRRGLRPLLTLAERVDARATGDLQPIGFEARHRELKPLVSALDTLLARLRQRVGRERAFVQDAAHEIRTPLAVINAQAHVLAHTTDREERLHAQAQLAQAIARSSHMAQQLLDLATLDSDAPLRTPPVDVAQWLRTTLAPAAQQTFSQDRELSLDAPDQLVWPMDLVTLSSIVHNLIDNAMRYGGAAIAVTLQAQDKQLTLRVQDNGNGIAAAHQTHVFERFWRGDHPQVRGSGLGLAIVQQASARLGGSVQIINGLQRRGVGFEVHIPGH